jgi:hypothetical protein
MVHSAQDGIARRSFFLLTMGPVALRDFSPPLRVSSDYVQRGKHPRGCKHCVPRRLADCDETR